MPSFDLKTELSRFQAELPLERAWMPPSSWYTAPSIYALEQAAVFTNSWQPIARRADLSAPGSFASGVLAAQPWVALRDAEGQLRAYHNTCRHKGREVVQGCGRADELVCGYHAWTYGLDGKLKRAPQMAGVQEFDRACMSLPPISIDTWGLWVFIHLGSKPKPLTEHMDGLTQALGGPDWTSFRYHSFQTWTIDCNWKVVCDNYLDGGYHIPHMHPSLDAQIDMQSYTTEVHENFSIQSAPSSPSEDERSDHAAGARIGSAARYAWLYPNWMLNRYGPCIDTNLVIPLGPDRSEVHYEFFFLASKIDADKSFLEDSIAQSLITQREDTAICESVQRGLASASYESGRYAPQLEIGEYRFHHLLALDLKAAQAASR